MLTTKKRKKVHVQCIINTPHSVGFHKLLYINVNILKQGNIFFNTRQPEAYQMFWIPVAISS